MIRGCGVASFLFQRSRVGLQKFASPPTAIGGVGSTKLWSTPSSLTSTRLSKIEEHHRRWFSADVQAQAQPTPSIPLKIFYGSQTGTALGFANQLSRELKKKKVKTQVIDLDTYEPEALMEEPNAIFIMACYGTGQPTDNAKRVYDWIMSPDRDSQSCLFKNMKFTIFGLGRKKTYADRYQAVARSLDRRLEQLGATRAFPKGEGNDDDCIEDDFIEWKDKLLKELNEKFLGDATATIPTTTTTCSAAQPKAVDEQPSLVDPYTKTSHWKILVPGRVPDSNPTTTEPEKKTKIDVSNPVLVPIVENRELRQPFTKRMCRHVSFDISSSSGAAPVISYEAGDHLGVFPKNSRDIVENVAKRLGVDLNSTFSIVYPDEDDCSHNPGASWTSVLPDVCSVDEALTTYCDLTSVPRRSVLEGLAHWATDASEKEKLFRLARSSDYNVWIQEDRRSVLEVMEAFPSVKPEFVHFVELLMRSPIQCRFYSISSSPKNRPSMLDLTVDIVQYVAHTGVPKHGLCSYYLYQRQLGDRVPVFVRTSTFRLPNDPQVPVIMVGAGTGLAPLRSFLQERRHLKEVQGKTLGEAILYFGCDYRAGDFLYGNELEQYHRDGIAELRAAFAFDQPTRVFVQHLMTEDSKRVWSLIEQGAHVYVCGNARTVGKGVHDTLVQVARTEGGMSWEVAEAFVKQLVDTNRFQEDVF